jgi:hypothetical protein
MSATPTAATIRRYYSVCIVNDGALSKEAALELCDGLRGANVRTELAETREPEATASMVIVITNSTENEWRSARGPEAAARWRVQARVVSLAGVDPTLLLRDALHKQISSLIASAVLGISEEERSVLRQDLSLVPPTEADPGVFRNCHVDHVFAVHAPQETRDQFQFACGRLVLDASVLDPELIDEEQLMSMLGEARLNDSTVPIEETLPKLEEYSRQLINERLLYFAIPIIASESRSLAEVCARGLLDNAMQRDDRFGVGLYLYEHPIDAILDWEQGRNNGPMAVVCCRVALGKVLEYAPGEYNPTLPSELRGAQSIRGAMRFGMGYVLYHENTALATHLVVCSSRIARATLDRLAGTSAPHAAPAAAAAAQVPAAAARLDAGADSALPDPRAAVKSIVAVHAPNATGDPRGAPLS